MATLNHFLFLIAKKTEIIFSERNYIKNFISTMLQRSFHSPLIGSGLPLWRNHPLFLCVIHLRLSKSGHQDSFPSPDAKERVFRRLPCTRWTYTYEWRVPKSVALVLITKKLPRDKSNRNSDPSAPVLPGRLHSPFQVAPSSCRCNNLSQHLHNHPK